MDSFSDVCRSARKELAAHDNGVPFYVAFPSSTIDWTISDGRKDIPIEQRNMDEVLQRTEEAIVDDDMRSGGAGASAAKG